MITCLVLVFIVLLLLGAPIAYCMGAGAYLSMAMYMPQAKVQVIAKMFGGLDSFSLMAVPFFILAGNLMDSSGISRQLVDFANMLVGRIKGGLAMTAVVSGVIFAGVSGSASADTSALAAILIPPMTEEGYEKGWSSCLIGTVGMLGPIIPPSLLAILYSAATGLSVGAIFLSGVIPGVVLALTLLIVSYHYATRNKTVMENQEKHKRKRTGAEIRALCISVIPALLMPFIIIFGILSGIFTATESAGVACVYAMLYGFISRRLPFKTLWKCLVDSAEGISKLKPAFKKDGGRVTAANASGINDSGAAVIVMSKEKADELGLKYLCKIAGYGSGGVDPSIMGVGPVPATKKALEKAGWTIDDLDLIEANEAFAAQSVAVARQLNFPMDKVNVNGGAIALGHPIGASGCRIFVTLIYEMMKRDAKKGLATLCIGGGQGTSLLVERD